LSLAAAALAGEPRLKTELRKAEDKIEVSTTNSQAVITVTSVSGIGGAKVSLAEGAWPTNVTIRLTVKTLESFSIGHSQTNMTGSLKDPGGLKITQQADHIQIVVPPQLLQANPPYVDFKWIDAYR
jgi:hypothetical protein